MALGGIASGGIRWHALSGTIPEDFSELVSLGTLLLSSNRISGTVPRLSVGPQEPKVRFLYGPTDHMQDLLMLENNLLSGTISHLVVSYIYYFAIGSNRLSGTSPNSLSGPSKWCTNLTHLQISSNIALDWDLSTLKDCPVIETLIMGGCSIKGTLSASPLPSSVTTLLLHANQITGELPAMMFGNASQLETFTISGNRIIGTLPSTISPLTSLVALLAYELPLSGSLPQTHNGQLNVYQGLKTLSLGRTYLQGGCTQLAAS